jgi:hypothetical protein
MTDHHHTWATIASGDTEYPHECGAYGVGKVGIELIGVNTPDVIGLDDLIE